MLNLATRALISIYQGVSGVGVLWREISILQPIKVHRGDEEESAYLMLRTAWRLLRCFWRSRARAHNATRCPPMPETGKKEVTKPFYSEAVHDRDGRMFRVGKQRRGPGTYPLTQHNGKGEETDL